MNPVLGIIAEITHRCPLHCVYCSNPLELAAREQEMKTEDWFAVFEQASGLGTLQVFFTGGEPLARADLPELIVAARRSKLYANLITSGIGLTPARLDELIAGGLDHIQLSFQGSETGKADEIAGARVHERKFGIAHEIAARNIAFTINVVVHKQNIAQLTQIIAMAEQFGAQKLEIAHAQYYGWAFENQSRLLPTRDQVEKSLEIVREAQQRLASKMRIECVLPDYYATYPKPCMGGWGQNLMVISPTGNALPCHAANVIPGLEFPNVRERTLRWIWDESPAFNRFRGENWMQEPCRSCERRGRDFGGCRCQAQLIAGDASATDPVCSLSAKRNLIEERLSASEQPEWVYRQETAVLANKQSG